MLLAAEPMSIMTLAEAPRTPVEAVEATVRAMDKSLGNVNRMLGERRYGLGRRTPLSKPRVFRRPGEKTDTSVEDLRDGQKEA